MKSRSAKINATNTIPFKAKLENKVNRLWYTPVAQQSLANRCLIIILLPFSWLYTFIQSYLSERQIANIKQSTDKLSTPVIIAGNLTIGGTGKTPLIISLAKHLDKRGIKVGIISRGYGGSCQLFPHQVLKQDSPLLVGDESLLLAQQLDCPIIIDPNRLRAAHYLQDDFPNHIDIILSDDGLQHYALPRDFEIVVVDQQRGFGNALSLPAGPLREKLIRLNSIGHLIINGDGNKKLHQSPIDNFQCPVSTMQIQPLHFRNQLDQQILPLKNAFDGPVHAVAGIGNPERFFNTLEQLNLQIIRHPLPDHYQYKSMPEFNDEFPIIITSKDSVKCAAFNSAQDQLPLQPSHSNIWVLDVEAIVEMPLVEKLLQLIN